MRRGSTNGRYLRLGSLVIAGALLMVTAACSDDPGTTNAGAEGGGPVELDMWLFGDFGYEPLIEQYQQDHPNVTITQKIAEFNEHHDALTTALASGSGAPDIAAVEVGFISRFKATPEQFHNLLDLGAADVEDQYLDWKWQQAMTGDGSSLIGLPTDVGGMAMAYRWDLFKKAGLPTERDEVAELWATWDDFLRVGAEFTDKTGVPFIDESSQLYAAVVGQADKKYYETDDTLIYGENPEVQEAFNIAARAVESGIVANIEPFAAEWNKGMNNGDFAVLTAPAWMMGYIQGQAPDTEGMWDIAALPEGGGNWGGSHLTVPAQTENAQEAYDFISWLLAPEQQLQVFEQNGNFPSTPDVYESPEIQNFANPFFHDAPVGPIYAQNALEITPVYEGPEETAIRLEFENALDRIEDGKETPAEAWSSALEAISLEVGS
ncbi:MAG: ABC transporter substrate-binding protein [Actinomycetota bacterium]